MITESEKDKLELLAFQKQYNLYAYGIRATDKELKEFLEKREKDKTDEFWAKLRGELK